MVEFSAEFLARLRACDTDAVDHLDRVCRPRLIHFVSRRLTPELRRRIEPEDVTQEALTHFMVLLPRRILDFRDSSELWRVLRNIVRHKLVQLRRRHFAAKRDVRSEREINESDLTQRSTPLDQHTGPQDIAASTDEVLAATEGMRQRYRGIVDLLVQGYSLKAIALAIRKSVRTVERAIEKVRKRLEKRRERESESVATARDGSKNTAFPAPRWWGRLSES